MNAFPFAWPYPAPTSPRSGRLIALVLAGIGAGLGAGCAPSRDPSPAASTPTAFVARVGDTILTDVEFASRLEQRLAAGSGDRASMAQKEPVFEEWIRQESIYAQARAARFDQRPDVSQAVRRLVVSKFQEEKLAAWNAAETVSVSDADVEARYRADPREYFAPAAVRGAVIFFGVGQRATPEKRQARRLEAEALREAAVRTDFRLLAARHSEDQTSRYRPPRAARRRAAFREALRSLRGRGRLSHSFGDVVVPLTRSLADFDPIAS